MDTRKFFLSLKDYNKTDFYRCEASKSTDFIFSKFQLDVLFIENLEKAKIFFIALLSMILCCFILFSVLMSKRISGAHPSKLIALISLTELFTCWSMMIWQFGSVEYFCYSRTAHLYMNTYNFLFSGVTSEMTVSQALMFLEESNIQIFKYF